MRRDVDAGFDCLLSAAHYFERIAEELDAEGQATRLWALRAFNHVSVARAKGDPEIVRAVRIAAERME